MAPAVDAKILFSILIITCYCAVALAEIPMDCCMQAPDKRFDRSRVVDYYQQIKGHGCAIDAMVFITRAERKICLSADGKWSKRLKDHVDQLKKDCKKNNFQNSRCVGVQRK